jgi:hypothetical protein
MSEAREQRNNLENNSIRRKHKSPITKINRLTLFKRIIAMHSKYHEQHIQTHSVGQMQLSILKRMVYIFKDWAING